MTTLRIGTRASALARWQAEAVRTALAAQGVAAELTLIRTAGDRDQETSLRELGAGAGGKGIFIKELEEALLDGRVDLAVHSMKDVPTELPAGLQISAMLPRHDVRDALVSREGLTLQQLPPGARVGSSSLRRQAQLRLHRSDLQMADIRGNVDTRLAKVARGDYDAAVLAKAGLDRLGLADRISEVLSTEVCLPAAGQGAVGIETRASDRATLDAVSKIDHAETHSAVNAERIVLAGLDGGCQVPMGVWARFEGQEIVIEACVLAADGSDVVRVARVGLPAVAAALAREVADELVSRGAWNLLQVAGGRGNEKTLPGRTGDK